MNAPIFDTKVVTNFLTEDEVNLILSEYEESHKQFVDAPFYRDGVLQNHTQGIICNDHAGNKIVMPNFKQTANLVETRLKANFPGEFSIGTMHILKSYQPYKCHTDGIVGQADVDDFHYGAYTFVIPLETVDSYTIVFNEYYENGKLLDEWLADNPDMQPKNVISDEIYNKHLDAEFKDYMNYLSIDTIFPWTKGACLGMSRYKFHGSDNFPKRIHSKLGIIVWTVCDYGPNSAR